MWGATSLVDVSMRFSRVISQWDQRQFWREFGANASCPLVGRKSTVATTTKEIKTAYHPAALY